MSVAVDISLRLFCMCFRLLWCVADDEVLFRDLIVRLIHTSVESIVLVFLFFFFQAEDGIRDKLVTGVQTCAIPILFGLRPEEVARAVGRLVATRALRADCVVDGWPGRWLVHAGSSTSRSREARRVCE